MNAALAYPSANILGEGPVWHENRKSFFWVDIEGKSIHEWNLVNQQVQSWPMPQRVGMIAVENDQTFIVALQDGLAAFNLESLHLEWLADIETDITTNRANDGKCDANGRLWLGTMDVDCDKNTGSLYCIDKNISIVKKLDGLTVSNGIAWQADNKRMYFIDSATNKVDSYSFNLESGHIVFEKTVVFVPAQMGSPDGMTIDEEGMLWVAHWNGFAVQRWNPGTGELLDTISLPAPQVSSCVFGGDRLDQLFITTARTGLSEESLSRYPMSGHVFIAQMNVRGLPANKFIRAQRKL